jgi:shikimate kinase
MNPSRIILIGYMGAGKTTIGRALARSLGLAFYDLDWYIEERFHKTVSQLFAERGEAGFRDIERNMLHEVAEFENVVLSCGGGTPCFFDNIDYMNGCAPTVYLKATPEVLQAHLKMGKTVRPLIAGKTPEQLDAFIRESLETREPFYGRASHTVHVDEVIHTPEDIQRYVDAIRTAVGCSE